MQFVKNLLGSILITSFCLILMVAAVYAVVHYGLIGWLYIFQGSIILSTLYVVIPYLLFLVLNPLYKRIFRTAYINTPPVTNFILVVPAHNEGRVLRQLLLSIKAQRYPVHLFKTVVIADNCDDDTEQIAKEEGVICFSRQTNAPSDKSQALYFGGRMMLQEGLLEDAVVCILDADCELEPQYLDSMDYAFYLPDAAPVIQSYRYVRNAFDSNITVLDAAAEALRQWVKSGTRKLLGLDNFIYGLGCAMRADLFLEITALPDLTLTEDRDWKAYLVNRRIRVDHCPTARLSYEVVGTQKAFKKQRDRWIAGRVMTFKKYSLKMLVGSMVRGSMSQFDFAIDMMYPPRSVITLLLGVFGVLAFFFPSSSFVPYWAWFLLLFTLMCYGLTGLWLINASFKQYKAVLSGGMIIFNVARSTLNSLLGRSVKTWDATRKETQR